MNRCITAAAAVLMLLTAFTPLHAAAETPPQDMRLTVETKELKADEIREEMNIYLNYARIAYVQMLKDIKPSSDYVIDGAQDLEYITMELLDIIMNRGNKK